MPSTNVTNFSLQYQSYLNDVFHTTWVARLGHTVCMPLIVTSMIAAARALGGEPGALIFTSVLLAWWLAWATLERDLVWGVALTATAGAMWLAAARLSQSGIAPWWPLAGSAFLQMFSHALEPLPPRVSRSPNWLPVMTYLTVGSLGERLRHVVHVTVQFVCGFVAEALASPRLICVVVLEGLWLLGWHPEQRAAWKALSRRAIASGNPALDYIGIGGGTTLRWADPSPQEAAPPTAAGSSARARGLA